MIGIVDAIFIDDDVSMASERETIEPIVSLSRKHLNGRLT